MASNRKLVKPLVGRGMRSAKGAILVLSVGLLPAASCSMELRNAVESGIYQFVTQATIDVLTNTLSIGDAIAPEDDSGESRDPFDGPPVQP